MLKLIEAIYSNGVLRPSEKLNLREGEKVEIEIRKKPQKIVSLRGIWKNIQTSEMHDRLIVCETLIHNAKLATNVEA